MLFRPIERNGNIFFIFHLLKHCDTIDIATITKYFSKTNIFILLKVNVEIKKI